MTVLLFNVNSSGKNLREFYLNKVNIPVTQAILQLNSAFHQRSVVETNRNTCAALSFLTILEHLKKYTRPIIHSPFLSVSSSEACASKNHFFFCLPTFMNCGGTVASICLFTEVKQQWATLVLGRVTALVYYSCL